MKRVLIHSHDSFGPGSLRRVLEVARQLVRSSPMVSVRVLSGSPMLHAQCLPPRVGCVKLPCLARNGQGRYGARYLDLTLDATVRLRADTIRSTIADFAPDLILVDQNPFGVEDELSGALSELPAGDARPRLVLLLRDILDSPEATMREWRSSGCFAAIEAYYDAVLVMGSPEVFDLRREYQFPPFTAAKVSFCGYVARAPGRRGRAEVRRDLGVAGHQPLVVVSAGGGADGHLLPGSYLEGLRQLPAGLRPRSHIICGPEMGDAPRAALRRAAAALPEVSLQDFSGDRMPVMAAADLVVATGGYDTVCELLALHQRALIVPRAGPGLAQTLRAERMARAGLLRMLRPERLSPAALLDAVRGELAAAQGPAARARLEPMDGLARCTAAIFEQIGLPMADPPLAPAPASAGPDAGAYAPAPAHPSETSRPRQLQ